jgi:hypothetical protein
MSLLRLFTRAFDPELRAAREKVMHVDEITELSFSILPAVVTKDDPLAQRAYFGWKVGFRGKRSPSSPTPNSCARAPRSRISAAPTESSSAPMTSAPGR